MGSDDHWAYPADGEGPVREITLNSFWVDAKAVSNEAFASFIEATGHATEAERFGWSFVFAGLLPDDFPPTQAVAEAPWWLARSRGACWHAPGGPGVGASRIAREPPRGARVVARRARRTAAWCAQAPADRSRVGVSRPRGGPRWQAPYPWGDELESRAGEHRLQRLAGHASPTSDTGADGYIRHLSRWHAFAAERPTGCTTWRATSGNGRQTGSIPDFASRIETTIPAVPRQAPSRSRRWLIPLP